MERHIRNYLIWIIVYFIIYFINKCNIDFVIIFGIANITAILQSGDME